jgi:hypothetical protein
MDDEVSETFTFGYQGRPMVDFPDDDGEVVSMDTEERPATEGRAITELFEEFSNNAHFTSAIRLSDDRSQSIINYPAAQPYAPKGAFLVGMITNQRQGLVDMALSMRHTLPMPVYTSPMALLCKGADLVKGTHIHASNALVDAIGSMSQLMYFLAFFADADHEKAEWVESTCKPVHIEIQRWVDAERTAAMDKLETQDIKDIPRARAFAVITETYTLRTIHAYEWFLMDVLKIPFRLRGPLFTPIEHIDASQLPTAAYVATRKNLCTFLENRMKVAGADHPDSWNPMNLNGLETRHLEPTKHGGLHKSYITCRTLYDYYLFLSKDSRMVEDSDEDDDDNMEQEVLQDYYGQL